MEYSPAIKKKEICLLHKRMDLEGIMLSEISETENDRHCVVSHVESKNAELTDIESKTGLPGAGGRVGERGDAGQRLQASSYQVTQF